MAQPAADALARLQADAGVPLLTTIAPDTRLLSFLRTESGRGIPGRLPATAPAEARALGFISSYGGAFGVADPRQVAVTAVSPRDAVEMEHVRFRQSLDGIPVTGGELVVHLSGSQIVAVNGRLAPDLDGVVLTPTLGPDEAVTLALAAFPGSRPADLRSGQPRLELFNRGLLEGRPGSTRLAWFVELRSPTVRDFLWIDAETGKPLLRIDQLTTSRDREVYDADDPGDGVYDDLPGTLARSEGESATGDGDTDDAYDYSGDTYDYFWNEHGRDSYDDGGATMVSTVHFCPSAGSCPYTNAFWDGTQMVYGEGFPTADDVDAHELTHAVTEYSANLFYYMQSGALNESFSDIFGETVDLGNSAGTDTGAVRWQMGEDTPLGALRDMMDPTLFGDPGKISDSEFVCNGGGGTADDRGGVHSNSGVPNHAYALMADGGTYNSHTVFGIGLTKAAKVQYRALSQYLISSSGFRDDYDALNQACQDLVGTAGITAGDCSEVDNALLAVELDGGWPCTSPAPPAAMPLLCTVPASPSIFSSFDFEAGSGLGPCPDDGSAPGSWCHYGPGAFFWGKPHATSGVNSIWGWDFPIAGTIGVSISIPSPPAGARMQFNHSYGFENAGTTYYDGGVLAYSTDGGSTFFNASGLVTAGATPGGVLSTCCGNPLGGSTAFVAESWGYTASQIDLASFAGIPTILAWFVSMDSVVSDYGWFLDDVRLYTCSTCVSDRTLTSAYNGSADLYQASNSIVAGSGFTVGLTESVVLEAGGLVRFDNDFSVDGGGELTVIVGSSACP